MKPDRPPKSASIIASERIEHERSELGRITFVLHSKARAYGEAFAATIAAVRSDELERAGESLEWAEYHLELAAVDFSAAVLGRRAMDNRTGGPLDGPRGGIDHSPEKGARRD